MPAPNPGRMAEKVRETLEKLETSPEDAALRALLIEYADTIDRAAEIAADAAKVPYDPDTAAQVARLRQRVEAHTVMVEVGPKLLAALDALGATPRARALAGKKPQAGKGKLHALRQGAS